MHIKNTHEMIEKVVGCAKGQFEKGIDCVDTEEMKMVSEIIKNLACAEKDFKISKAMDHSDDYEIMEKYDEYRKYYKEPPYYHTMPDREYNLTMDMYKNRSAKDLRDMDRYTYGRMYYTENDRNRSNRENRDVREGRSGISRRTYMETREQNNGNSTEEKKVKMQELEKWMNDIAVDVKEMVAEMTPEERTLAKQKIMNLSNSI